MLKLTVLQKYYNCSIIVTDINNITQEFNAHKLLLANLSNYFENLFDFENKYSYHISIPFDINIFTKIYNSIYKIKTTHIEKDFNYYENKLYALYYLCYDQKYIIKLLNKIILYIETCYKSKDDQYNLSSFIQNLNSFNLIPDNIKNDLINRISLDTFIENYYDPNNKKLVLTNHLYKDNFDIEKIMIDDIIFCIYHTIRCDVDQIGFWIEYEKIPNYTGDKKITTAKGKLIIYNGFEKLVRKIKKLSKGDRSILTFEKDKGRYGEIEEYVSCDYNFINQDVCAYKIILQFD